jgi:hypothetical protein
MVGPYSRLILPPAPRHDAPFELAAFISPIWAEGQPGSQRIRILVNGYGVFDSVLTEGTLVRCPVPADMIALRPQIEIVIEHENFGVLDAFVDQEPPRGRAALILTLTLLGFSPLPVERAPVFSRPVFLTRPFGNFANRMIQYMVALHVRELAPNCVLAGLDLPEWGIVTRPDDGTWADLALTDEQRIDVPGVAALLASQSVTKVVHRGFGQRMENFLPRERYADVFRSAETGLTVYGPEYLLINIRTGDVVAGTIAPYVLLPVAFYRDVIAQTGLAPVFMGQLEPNAYTEALRAAFPDAVFHESQGAVRDFETIRRAANIVVAVSTFSWLAAWLSDAQTIHLPVSGLFNPLQMPDIDLLPLGDARYRFWLFPVNEASPDFHAAHAAMDGQWREVDAGALAVLRQPGVVEVVPAPASPREAPAGPAVREDIRPVIAAAEAAAGRGYAADVLHHLRYLPLMDYAELMWSLPRADLPEISRVLPRMAPSEAQLMWNGTSGQDLCQHSVDVCRILSAGFQRLTGRPMEQLRVMDFGSGWGRLTRLMYYFTDPQNVCAVDAMDQAIERMHADGVLGRVVKCNHMAHEFDAGEHRYDLIFAYSVFVHTPLAVAQTLMATLHRKLRRNGVLALTVRPVELWSLRHDVSAEQRAALVASHRETGFAFLPEGITDAEGADVYGETTIHPDWFAANCPDWEIEGVERGMDPMQLIVFLTPR